MLPPTNINKDKTLGVENDIAAPLLQNKETEPETKVSSAKIPKLKEPDWADEEICLELCTETKVGSGN